MADVDIVGFDRNLLEHAARLRADVFGGTTELNREYFAWKYERNPYLVDPLVHFAVSTEGVVGMRASMGTCWEVRGVRYILPHGGDVMVDARFRRQGILRRMQHAYLAELEARGFDIAFSLSGGAMGTPAMVAGGWSVLMMLETLEYTTAGKPTRIERAYDRSRALVRRAARARPVNPLSRVMAFEDDDVEVLAGDAFDRLAGLAARPSAGDRLRHVRDSEYFRWRLGNPLSRYCVLASRAAYVILQWGGGSEPHVSLVDWHAPDSDALARILTALLRRVGSIQVWRLSSAPQLASILESCAVSVVALPARQSFTLRSVTGDPRDARLGGLDLNELQSWELQMLDSDAF